jgi:vancomycin resistance protein YoaR
MKAYYDISQLVKNEMEVIEYTLSPDVVEPEVKRADIEKQYQLCSTFTTELSAYSSAGRIQNITRALEALDNRVWMPGEVFSFNQWVGARTVENGFGLGVFINEDQQYDETVGGGICQVSTTIYYSALLAGANSVGRNAPIEIIERRPHTWPSVYIARGLDATVSWPHTDLKMYNNNHTPYFMNTDIVRKGSKLYVTVEFYGMPLPNGATVRIETETIQEIAPGEAEYIVDTKNKYNLALNQEKQVSEARTGYTVNVYQIWNEPGKEPVKSLLTVSKYEPIKAKIYISPETYALRQQQAAQNTLTA